MAHWTMPIYVNGNALLLLLSVSKWITRLTVSRQYIFCQIVPISQGIDKWSFSNPNIASNIQLRVLNPSLSSCQRIFKPWVVQDTQHRSFPSGSSSNVKPAIMSSSTKGDPRRPENIVPYHIPKNAAIGDYDWAGTLAMVTGKKENCLTTRGRKQGA